MQGLRIVLLSVAAAVVYGIVHDQVTARICIEYFTIGHTFIGTNSPLLLGLFWGVVATWWVGLPLGLVLWLAARAGSRPPRYARDLVRPVAKLLCVVGCGAILAGATGNLLARNGAIWLPPRLAEEVPKDRHVAFLTDLWSHTASYWVGSIGGIVLVVLTWRQRGRVCATAG